MLSTVGKTNWAQKCFHYRYLTPQIRIFSIKVVFFNGLRRSNRELDIKFLLQCQSHKKYIIRCYYFPINQIIVVGFFTYKSMFSFMKSCNLECFSCCVFLILMSLLAKTDFCTICFWYLKSQKSHFQTCRSKNDFVFVF